MTSSRFDWPDNLWDGIKPKAPGGEPRPESEQSALMNKLEVKVNFRDHRIEKDYIQNRLSEYYSTIALVDPLVRDASAHLEKHTIPIVTDMNGVVISCPSEDVIGYCCPAADLVNNNDRLKSVLERGNVLEVQYDNGMRSQLVPIFNERGEIKFYWGITDTEPIKSEVSNILCLAAQLVQQRYYHLIMMEEYSTSFLNAMPDCVVLLDEHARIINANDAFLALLRVNDKRMIKGMHARNLVSPLEPDHIHEIMASMAVSRQFTLTAWGLEIPCLVTNTEPIQAPFGTQLILSFKPSGNTDFSAQLSLPETASSSAFDRIVYASQSMKDMIDLAKKAASSSVTVLISGETGTGKELLAEAIHRQSGRRGRFIAINCGAIPAELIQSELFGYEEGAFTGAKRKGSPGKFEAADGGTIFLDEIGEMPLDLQVSLLRFLQDKTIIRVGGLVAKKVDVRIIAATNRDLKEEVVKGRFREDLFYRLNVIHLELPPLRSRKEDIPPLAEHFLKKAAEEHGASGKRIPVQAMELLMRHDWPGNARELQNAIERALILSPDENLQFDTNQFSQQPSEPGMRIIENSVAQVKKATIEQYLRLHYGNISKTAAAMGVTRQTLYRQMKELQISYKTNPFKP